MIRVKVKPEILTRLLRVLGEKGFSVKFIERTPGEDEINIHFEGLQPSAQEVGKIIFHLQIPEYYMIKSENKLWKLTVNDQGTLNVEEIVE